jgi:subtilisin family serine protease/subtilisin-like proprotein convertase family protein
LQRFRVIVLEGLEPRRMLSAAPELDENLAAFRAPAVASAWFAEVPSPLGTARALPNVPLGPAPETQLVLWKDGEIEAMNNQWIVRLSPEAASRTTPATAAEPLAPLLHGGRVIRGLGFEGVVLVETPQGFDPAAWLGNLGGHPEISYLEPNSVIRIQSVPDDPFFPQLWGLHNTGQTGGTPDADIDAPEAWEIATGSASIVVGVIDTGVDYHHPDLAANMWVNPGEIPGNGIDDDGNGFIDDVYGYNFVSNHGNPIDDHRHGTHVAGTIAGVGNNGTGVVGVNWTSSIMALKFLGSNGSGTLANAVRAINYATMMRQDYGVDIRLTNNSWGGGGYQQSLADAIAASGSAGMLFVAAAGNSGSNNDRSPHYPSSYDLDNIIAVAATDHNDQLASFSCYGATSVDLAAPGVNTYSTLLNGGYGSLSGTSMASPHVAGVAALAWSTAPNATPEQIRDAILGGVDPKPNLAGKVATGGRLNARGTLNLLGMNVARTTPAAGSIVGSAPTQFTVDFTHAFDPETVEATALLVNGIPAGTAILEDANTVIFQFDTPPVSTQGPQQMLVPAGAVLRDSDGDPTGEWTGTFFYDLLATEVVATTPGEGHVLTSAPVDIVLHFNEPIDPTSISADNLVLDWGTVTDAAAVGNDSARYTVTGLTRDGRVRYQLLNRAVRDAHGTPASGYTGYFTIDDPLIDRYPSADVPKNIPDRATITSTLTISGEEGITIADLDVQLDITHTWVSDLDVYLIAPDGTRVELFTDVGGGGNNFTDTILDDEAPTSIATATAPFTGRFRPEGLLSTVDGFDARGTWTLEVTDDSAADVGTLHRWELIIERDIDIEPRINSVQPLPPDGGRTWAAIDSLNVRFSEVMDAASVNKTANWELIEAGPDQTFDTPDDVPYVLSLSPTYVNGLHATLAISGGALPEGLYRLTAISNGLKDLLGNPLDGNADGTGGDDYVRHFDIMPRVSAIPFTESFEAGTLAGLGGYWEFDTSPTGRIRVSNAQGPRSGLYHLLLDQTAAYAGPQYATLHLDLVGQSGLALDFWQKDFSDRYEARDDRVQMSADGQKWYDVVILRGTNSKSDYQHFTIDLDAAIDAAGISYTENFLVRFSQDNYYLSSGGFAFDDIRVSQLDLFGPRVLSSVPGTVEAGGGPLSRITVTFDEPIDVASFTGEDVNLRDPRGVAIAPVAVTPVGGSGDTQFDLDFAAQDLRGTYRLTVGPQVLDLSGNPMNQNGNAVNGEAADAYSSTVVFRQTVWTDIGAEPELYVEGFEEAAWDGGAPSHWSLIPNGNGTVTAVTSGTPQSGTRHLRFKSDSGSSSTSQYATLAVDLSSMASRDDVMLSFWARRETSSTMLYVELGGNGVSFQNVWSVSLPAAYTQYTLDLSALALDKGIALDEDVYVRFRHHSGYGYVAYLDDVRITAGLDLFGPRVLSRVPGTVEAGGGPLSRITVTFDEPIDVASFTEEDVNLRDPRGVAIAPVAVTPVGDSGDTQFDLDFAAQDLRGTYRLTVGPQILDLSGNPMNQNGNAVNGEAADAYSSTVVFRQTVWTDIGAEPELYVEGFEEAAWDGGAPSHWSLIPNGNGTVTAVTSGTPQSGTRHLRFKSDSGSSSTSQYATLAVDLSSMASRDDVMLSFWARRETSSTMLYVELGGNGVSFQNVWSVSLPAAYTQYTLDLSALALDKGIALDEDVYVRFRHHSGYGYVAYLDDVRITAGLDLFGPRVLSRVPGTVEAGGGPLSRITVTFDEPIDVASFTEEDVSLRDPRGVAIAPVAVTPVGDSGDTQFDLDFAAQDLRGTYRLTVGPQVLDLSGNPMNQNGNAVNGEAADAYSSTVVFRQTVWTDIGAEPELYVEGFEGSAWDGGAPAHWSLIPNGNGTVTAVTSGTPQSGTRHLRFLGNSSSSYLSQYATLAVDLSSMASRDDVMLSFWARRETSSTMLYVELGGNGVSFQNVWSVSLPAAYTQYTLDLSALALDKGIALDEDVYVRFRHHSGYGYVAYLDDVRITAGLDLFGPRVLSSVPGTVEAGGGPLSRITVTFDEPIEVASFTAEDVVLKDAQGNVIEPVTVTPVVASGDTQFDLTFGAQDLRGVYRLSVGPEITDLAGNLMNQNGNAINGEAADAYAGTVRFAATVWSPPPGPEPTPRFQVLYEEPFEDFWPVPTHWAFETMRDGTIGVTTAATPQAGTQHLEFRTRGSVPTQSAVLAVDLTGYETADDLFLTFWAKQAGTSGTLYVDLSGNGTSWQNVATFSGTSGLPAAYTNFTLDLDSLAADKGVARDEDFYVRFRSYSSSSSANHFLYLDDVRIVAGDLMGPRVVSQSPVSLTAGGGPLSTIRLTFDEPIAVASFTAEDVVLKDAQGNVIEPVTVTPVVASGDTQFDLTFGAQDLRGVYRLSVGPEITDLAGNLMNQNGNAINGEAADAYAGTVRFAATVWSPPPGPEPTPRFQVLYEEPFEDFWPVPTHWAFETMRDGTIGVTTAATPQAGTQHLEFRTRGSVPTQSAVLAVDLTGYETADDLFLTFWAKQAGTSGTLYVDLSGNGTSWQNVATFSGTSGLPAAYTNFTLDLDSLAADKGVARDEDFYVRFRSYSSSSSANHLLYLDDVRIVAGDLMGPMVVGHWPLEPIDGPVTSFTVTFDEPIGDFPLEEARLWGPLGNAILPTAVTSSDALTWTVTFPSQELAGRYQFKVGPGIRDVQGNLMNQDRDAINGETNGHDEYNGQFFLNYQPLPASYPYFQGFEDATELDDHWYFRSGTGGRIQIVADSGDRVLRIDSIGSSTHATSEAVFAIDLAGQTGVKLFWNEYNPADEMDATDGVFVSSDQGATWFRIDPLSGKNPNWQSRVIDLDAAIQTAQIDYSHDFRIKFQVRTNSTWTSDGRQFDDIRVTWEGDGPKVVGTEVSGSIVAPFTLDGLTFTFDKAIDASTFTLADVISFTGPDNADLTGQLTRVSGSGTTFTVHFVEQTAPGAYTMTIGPYILDLAGNPMDQNSNGLVGETFADRYTARTILLQPVAYPYYQGFDGLSGLEDLSENWAFIGNSTHSRIQLIDEGSDRVLRVDSTGSTSVYVTNEAIFAIDLAGRSDVKLFLLERNQNDPVDATDGVWLSDDRGLTWYRADPLGGTGSNWQNRVVDLDAAIAAGELAYTNNFLIKLQHYGRNAWTSGGRQWDDIRVTWEGDGPKVVGTEVSGSIVAPFTLDGLTFTFDKAIDASTFTLADVISFTGPDNTDLTGQLTGVSGSGTTFTVHFVEQTAPGAYTMTIGPYILDLAGNPMDQNSNGLVGETHADRYTARTILLQPVAYPYYQGFDGLSGLEDLSENWAFIGNSTHSRIQLIDEGSDRVLRVDSTGSTSVYVTNEAIFAIDLAGRSDVKLFLLERNQNDPVDATDGVWLSDDRGLTWYRADPLGGTNSNWQNRVVDLDAAIAAGELAYTDNFLIKLQHYGRNAWSSGGRQWDDIRVTWEGDGPKVVGTAVSGSAVAPFTLDGLTFTFDKAIDASTFTLADVISFTGPDNTDLTGQLTGVSGSGTTFTVHFAEQTAPGAYTMSIGPYILDLAGNPMDQNSNGLVGETYADRYTARTILLQPVAYPYYQGFDGLSGLEDLSENWAFIGNSTHSRIQLIDEGSDRVLRVDSTGSTSVYVTNEAIFAIDLTGRSDVKLFLLERNQSDPVDATDGVWLSDDRGLSWYRADPLGGTNSNWQNRVVDLDAAIAAGNLSYTNNFLIKLQHYGRNAWTSGGRQWDDIRVTWEGDGPKVVGTEISGSIVAPFTLDGLTFTFDKAIDASTFTLADVISFTGPDNTDLTGQLTGVTGSGTTFTVHFAEQTAPGAYTMRIGPYILDLAGNPMDQNGNGLVGETIADRYTARTILLQPVAYPYYQGFDGLSGLEDLSENWAFIGNSTHSRIQLVDDTGDRVLRVDSASSSSSIYVTNEAVFAIDLAGRSDVKLFLLEQNRSDPVDATDGVWLSDDRGLSWYRADTLGGTSNDWQSRVVDLDAAILAGNLSYTNNFLIKLQHYGRYGWTLGGRQWDDIRVTWEGDGPKVVGTEVSGSIVAPFTLDGLTFTFDKAIDASTFTLADVISFTGPDNTDLTGQLTGVTGSGTTFTVHFAEQTAPGAYTMRIGPYILDLAGNPMDQNGNGLVGETIADRYTARTILLQPVAYPYYQGFDGLSGLEDLSENWAFIGNSTHSRIQLINDAGDRVLRVDSASSSSSVYVTNEAIFAIDLAGRSDVKLFLLEQNRSDPVDATDGVWLSDDRGLSWYRADTLGGTSNDWQSRVVDLDAAILAGNLSYTNNFLIKLQHYGRYGWTLGGRQWDDIRVTWEGDGPRVLAAAPAAGFSEWPYSLSGITFTFSEPIDPASFTIDDVVAFTGPDGTLKPLVTGVSGSGTTYTVHFAEQTVNGRYTMVIGPYILDLAANPMDQDGNGLPGETVADRYAFTLGTRYYVNDSDTAQDVWSTAPGDNSNNGLTPATPKATVQAILAAYDLQPGDEIRVDVGTYLLASDIVLGAADGGNATAHVMIRGVPGKTVLDRGSSGSVFHLSGQHYTVEGMVLRNGDYGVRTSSNGFGPLLMRNNIFEGQKQYGFFLHRGDATLLNNTFYAAGAHGLYGGSSNLTVRNNIFHVSGAEKYAVQLVNVWADPLVYRHDYDYNDYFVTDDAAVGYYLAPRTDLSAWQAAIGKDAHSISVDPLFADPAGGDFHLKSQGGRYEPATGTWVIDSVHSPAIDAGDPASPFANEPAPHGGRINMGAYGNTAQASKADTLPMLLEMTIVHAPSTTDVNGQVVALPANEPWVHEWQSFWVEIWVSTPDSTALGVAEAQVNLLYHGGFLTAQEIVYGPAWEHPEIEIDGQADFVTLQGWTERTDVGDDAYVLLARVRFASTGDDHVPAVPEDGFLGPYDMAMVLQDGQTRLVGRSSQVPALGDSPNTELWAVMYDFGSVVSGIDEDNQIDFGDFSFFAAAFGKSVGPPQPPHTCWADFDRSGRVDFGDLAFFAPNFGKTRTAVQAGEQSLVFPPDFPDAWRTVPAVPGGEGEAMGGGDVLQASFAGMAMLAGFDSLQESRAPSLRESSASEDTQGFVQQESPTALLGAQVPAAADAIFARSGTAEAERTPSWLRPRTANGHRSRLLEDSQSAESPVTLHSRSDAFAATLAERPHRWSEHWEPLEDLLSLLADEPHARLLDPHEAHFGQVGG